MNDESRWIVEFEALKTFEVFIKVSDLKAIEGLSPEGSWTVSLYANKEKKAKECPQSQA